MDTLHINQSDEEMKQVLLEFDAWVKKWDVDEIIYAYLSEPLLPHRLRKAMEISEEVYRQMPRVVNRKGQLMKRKVVRKAFCHL